MTPTLLPFSRSYLPFMGANGFYNLSIFHDLMSI